MKKILIGYIIDGKHSGIDKYLINFVKSVYSKDIQIDILTNKIEMQLQEELEQYNVSLIEIPSLKHPIKQYKKIQSIIDNNKYDIAYFNISEAFNCIGVFAAKNEGVKKVIVHSHASYSDEHNRIKRNLKITLNNIFKRFLYKKSDMYLACSNKAGEWLFPKNVINSDNYKIIYNAVDFDKFKFDENVRQEERVKMKLQNKLVLGHIGNFCYSKNHNFLIEIAKYLKDNNFNFKLLLIGIGQDYENIKQKIQNYNLESSVEMLGLRDDVQKLLQVMDVFLLPSFAEGLPISGVEAQISGLDCIFSENITKDVCITEKAKMLPIENAELWGNEIIKIAKNFRRSSVSLNNMVEKYSLKYQKVQFDEIIN